MELDCCEAPNTADPDVAAESIEPLTKPDEAIRGASVARHRLNLPESDIAAFMLGWMCRAELGK